jgi:hypothetical protein
MKLLGVNMRSWLPRRRERHWRYVSPHRRSAGVVLLALLTVGVAAYWVVPRMVNRWTRTEAAAYLRSITGGHVRIKSARFSLFGGIEIGGVRIDAPNSPPGDHLFEAETVVLHHRPWSLLTEGRLEPTEISCPGSTVMPGIDTDQGRFTFQEFISQISRAKAPAGEASQKGPLPVISFRDVRLRVPKDANDASEPKLLNISMVPRDGQYRIVIEEQRAGQEPIRATWRLDLVTGEVELLEGTVPKIADVDKILPKYSEWRQRYNIRGKVVLKGRPDSAAGAAFLDAKLYNVSLRFPIPPEPGGKKMSEVCNIEMSEVFGTLTFRKDGVTACGLKGRIPQAGGARFELSGLYGGYDANSPFELSINASQMSVPTAGNATDWLGDMLNLINESYKPEGKLDMDLVIVRKADGRVEFRGSARPLGMTATYEKFPYTVDQVTGTVRFTGDANGQWLTLEDVRGRHGSAEIVVTGRADLAHRNGPYDITAVAENVTLDQAVHNAIPAKQRHAWEGFLPAGRMGARFRTWKVHRGDDPNIDLTLLMDGRASMQYVGFPYRLEELTGQVRVDDDRVAIDSVKGRRGPMRATVDGTFSGPGSRGGQVNITIEATDAPLDANLVAALPQWTRASLADLHVAGRARRVSAWVRQQKDQPLDFRVAAHIGDASIRPEGVNYSFEDADGALTIRPGRMVIEQMTARHGSLPVQASGQVLLDPNQVGVDLLVKAPGARLDDELRKMLPEDLQKTWARLAPSGRADLELSIRHSMSDQSRPYDYRLVVDANGMGLRYAEFPYALTDIRGRAVATNDEVRLTDISARHGNARFSADGRMTFTPKSDSADLAVRGSDVPIDKELLEAVPDSLALLARRFQPGGTCQLDLKRLRVVHVAGEPNAPAAASAPATAPTTGPAGGTTSWLVDGRMSVDGATVDIGLGHKTLSGSLSGSAAQVGQDLSVDAAVELDSVRVGKQQLTKLSGRLSKKSGGHMMRLTDLVAAAHGGQVAGFGEVRLVDPLEIGLSISVRDLHLEDMVSSGAAGAPKDNKIKGLLTGNLQLSSIEGPKPRRQASGVLKISRGELVKLPVMLGLLNVMYLNLPGDTAFTDGELTYHLRNDDLIFDEIYFRGPALSIVGSGRMDMKTEMLDLKFLSGPPQKLPRLEGTRLEGIIELLEGIARELAEIHVDGTLAKPRMRTVPLRSLDRLLRDLLNPGGTK